MSNQRALRVHYVTTIVRRAQIICSRVVFGTIIFVWKKCSKTTLKNQIFAYLVTRWIFAKVAFILPWAESTSADKESIRIAWSSSSLPIARDICFNWPTKQNQFLSIFETSMTLPFFPIWSSSPSWSRNNCCCCWLKPRYPGLSYPLFWNLLGLLKLFQLQSRLRHLVVSFTLMALA